MRQGLTELVFILDKSGSMNGLEADTIGGYNSMITKQKKEEGQALVSTVLFNTSCDVIYDRVNLDKIEAMTDKDYCVSGCTALLDAMGGAIKHIKNVHKYAREEDVPEKTLFVIITDGMENSSRIFTYSDIKKLVEDQQAKSGWEFIFLGANIDAISEAAKFGIGAERAVRYECDEVGTQLNYEVVADAISSYRSCAAPSMAFNDGSWKKKIEKDFKKRHKK